VAGRAAMSCGALTGLLPEEQADFRSMGNRNGRGQFAKGSSGNPGGRPKQDTSLRDLARSHTAEAIETLLAIMRSKRAPASARVTAACAILDRGYGKPAQFMELEHNVPATDEKVNLLALARKVALILRLGDQALDRMGSN